MQMKLLIQARLELHAVRTDTQEIRTDTQEIQADTQEIRSDTQEILVVVKSLLPTPPSSLEIKALPCPPVSPYFIGREEILHALSSFFSGPVVTLVDKDGNTNINIVHKFITEHSSR